jgi:hypothetical protein
MALLLVSCDWGNPYSNNTNGDDVDLNFINLVIAIDMTSRILSSDQVKEDISTINLIIDNFEDRQKKKQYKSLDRISIEVISAKSDNILQENLMLVMTPNGGRRKFEGKLSTLKENIQILYNHYSASPSESKDIYSIFRDYVPSIIKKREIEGNISYSNKLVIISDGYFTIRPDSPISRGLSSENISQLIKSDDWRGDYNSLSSNVEPLKNQKFDNLQILLFGMGSDVSSGSSNEYLILKQFWNDWLDKMGIENEIIRKGTLRNNNSNSLKEFLSSQHIIDRYSFPFESSGNQYFLSHLKDKEIVKNNEGIYFKVNLTNSTYSQALSFKNGRYVINNIDTYKGAFIEFAESVLKHLDQDKNGQEGYKIFVKGTADALGASTFRARQTKPYIYNSICYLSKQNNSSTYSGPPQCLDVPIVFTNSELPNLRGKFIIDMFSVYLNQYNLPIQLQGSVSYDISKDDRNAVIYLYLPRDLYLN